MAEAKWYIVHAYSNFEKKVAQAIRDQAAMKGLEEMIEDLEVPTEEVVEVVRGKKKTIEKRYFPGYVLMKAKLTDDVYHLVKDTPMAAKNRFPCHSAKLIVFSAPLMSRSRIVQSQPWFTKSAKKCASTKAPSKASRELSKNSTQKRAA